MSPTARATSSNASVTTATRPRGSPSESFAWVGDRQARFVVLPAGSEWYPTEQVADCEPISATVVDSDATSGTYAHPELPYEITVSERERSD